MTKQEIQQLRQRWSGGQIRRINRLLAAGATGELEVPRMEIAGISMLDLRGVTLNQPVHDHHFERINFSWCIADVLGQFVNAVIRECSFVGAELDHTNFGDDCTRCDFTEAALKVMRGTFRDCSFARANMTRAAGTEVAFIRCDFTDGNWRKAQFYDGLFDHCTWFGCKFRSGSLAMCRFRGTRPDPAALGNTIMDETEFE